MQSEILEASSTPSSTALAREGKYLTFSLANQEYGIGILKVREIMGMMPITAVPKAPDYVKGVINLRGKIIPVVDFRLRFGMEAVAQTEQTCIIVVDVEEGRQRMLTGVVVDSVSEVINIGHADIEDAPSFSAGAETDFILGMAKVEKGVKILLDIDRILNVTEISRISQSQAM